MGSVFAFFVLYVTVGEMIYSDLRTEQIQWMFSAVLCVGLLAAFIVFVNQIKKGKISLEEAISMVIFWGFLIRLLYVQYTQSTILARQNDVLSFSNRGGHLGYIWTVWSTGWIPEGDPRSLWEYYQPPLYYLICGYFAKISSMLKVPLLLIPENVQLVSLFCVTGITIYLNQILVRLKLSARIRLYTVIIFSLLPFFTYLSGAINNDALLYFLITAAFYYTLKWYDEPKIGTLVLTAFLTGFAVMTKLSGSLIAPAILAAFLIRLVRDKEQRGRRLLSYLLFGVISLPLGLWWNFRNTLVYKMPFLYFCEASKKSVQYITNYTVW